MNPKYIYTSFIKKMSYYEEIDADKFILEVKKHECIWNVRSKHYNMKCYGNREIKRQAWENIGRVFNANWDIFSAEERQKKVDSMTRKWTNIRKYYTEELRRPSDEGPAKKKQRRRYHDLLTFLDDSVTNKRTTRIDEFKTISQKGASNDSSDSESNELCIVEDEHELARLSQNYDKDKEPNVEQTDVTHEASKKFQTWDAPLDLATRSAEKKNVATQTVEECYISRLNEEPGTLAKSPVANHIPNIPSESILSSLESSMLDLKSDACRKFLLSLLPEIMSLDVKQNMQFRVGIMDLLNDIKFKVNNNY